MFKKSFLVFVLMIMIVFMSTNTWGAGNDVAFSPIIGDTDLAETGRLIAVQANVPAGNPDNPLACPLNSPPYVAGMDIIERADFCVYYQEDVTSDYDNGILSPADATLAADIIQDYWDRYVTDFGFLTPAYVGKLEILLEAGGDPLDCNGATGAGINYLYAFTQCYKTPESIQKVLGHELFHRVQYSYDGSEVRWFKEGTARAMEDNAFSNIDNWATTLTAISSSFNKQVNSFLSGGTHNNDITDDFMRYHSALWWKYFTEQYGSTPGEPELGVDAFLTLWQAAAGSNDLAALNSALSTLGAGVNFDTAFRHFAVANWTKDLTGVPDDSYNYVDEDQVGNGAPYGPLVPDPGGTINTVTTATWNNEMVSRYGMAYYAATPGADCPAISVSFHEDSGPGAFYHVVTQIGNAFQTHVEGSGTDWTQSFLNNGITNVVAIIGGQANDVQVDLTMSCTDPVIEIEQPNTGAPAYVGNFGSPDDIVVQVSVTDGSPTGPVVGGLTNADFSVEVGGVPAVVLPGGGFVQEEYFLLIDTPVQGGNGPYDLEVFLEEPGTSTVIASDLENDAVVYDNTNTDHVIITDVSGSMGWDGKMQAARDAANLFIDASNSTDGLGLASFSTDVVDTLGIQFGILPHRNAAHAQVNGYVPTLATSIGDGLNEAVNQRAASPTGNARCQFTLLSDGMENQPLNWIDVQAAVVATGCPVMTVAFGADSNELLMQDIATATGGASYYNDVFVSSEAGNGGFPDETELDLGDTYLYALCEGQGCQRLLSERGALGYAEVMTHSFTVDDSLTELATVLDWMPYPQAPGDSGGNDFELFLRSPSGVLYEPDQYTFASNSAGYVGYRLPNPETGEWQALVISFFDANNKPYQLSAFGQSPVAVRLLLPAVQEAATGDYMPLYAMWRPGGHISATITPMNGISTTIPLHDDGQHGDGAAGDGFFAGLYTLVNQAEEVQPVEEEGGTTPPAEDEGGYSVHLLATDGDLRRETKGAFSVPEGDDSNNDGIPDDFIAEHCPAAPNSDADLDQLSCSDEYFTGTDPNNSDTDSGGENDGSEVLQFGLDPLDPADDQIAAPDFLQTLPQNGSVLLTYDVKGEYTTLRLFRATSPNGPWFLRVNELPLDGDYEDTATNDNTYYYRLLALDAQGHGSRIPSSTEVTPSLDPIPPAAQVLINGNAPSTQDRNVVLSFNPYEGDAEEIAETFDDIVEMMISNDQTFAGASWQPFAQDVPWELDATTPGLAHVYVRFRDAAGNESIGTEVGSIYFQPNVVYLPVMLRQP